MLLFSGRIVQSVSGVCVCVCVCVCRTTTFERNNRLPLVLVLCDDCLIIVKLLVLSFDKKTAAAYTTRLLSLSDQTLYFGVCPIHPLLNKRRSRYARFRACPQYSRMRKSSMSRFGGVAECCGQLRSVAFPHHHRCAPYSVCLRARSQ